MFVVCFLHRDVLASVCVSFLFVKPVLHVLESGPIVSINLAGHGEDNLLKVGYLHTLYTVNIYTICYTLKILSAYLIFLLLKPTEVSWPF